MDLVMQQKFMSMTLDFIEQQRSHMHRVVDEYVDMVMGVGRNQASCAEQIQPCFSEVYDMINKAVKFLALKCEEIKCETLSHQTSEKMDVIINDDVIQQSNNAESHVKEKDKNFASKFPSSSKPVEQELDADSGKASRGNKIKSNQHNWRDALYEELEKQLQNLLAKQGDMEKKLDNKFADFRKEIDRLNSEVRLVSCFFKNGEVLEDFSEKLNSLELTTLSQSEKINKINETLQFLTENQQKNDFLVKRMDDSDVLMSSLREKGQDDLIKVERQLEEAKINHKVVCQLLVSRLKPLEQLRNVLNNKLRERDHNITKLHSVAAELTEISKSVNQLKNTTQLTGFMAEAVIPKGVKACSIIGSFISCNCNGDVVQFDQSTGIFTAFVDGIYMACICVYHKDCSVKLMHRLSQTAPKYFNEFCVFVAKTSTTDTNVCRMGLIEMKKGDILFTCIENDSGALKIIKFFCYRIT